MFFFKKREVMLPFELVQLDRYSDRGCFINVDDPRNIRIRIYGDVFGEQINYTVDYWLAFDEERRENGDVEQIRSLLSNSEGKKLKVRFKMKKGKVHDFKIAGSALASAYGDERMKFLLPMEHRDFLNDFFNR